MNGWFDYEIRDVSTLFDPDLDPDGMDDHDLVTGTVAAVEYVPRSPGVDSGFGHF